MEESTRGQSPLSVLVAEDEDALRHVLRRALEKTGFTVFEASNGKKALEIFQRERPSIVLLDAVMPGMNGFELCAHLRQTPGGARLPILIITSLEDESSVARAFGAGATDYLTKPVRITVLCQRILRLVQASRAEAQLAETNAYLQSLVYHVPDGVVTFDERGIIESFNPSAEQILGFSASEAIGKSIQHILGLPSQTSFVPSSTRQETFARRKDGSVFNLEVSVSEFDFHENKRFTAILRDITSRKQAEIELRNSQQKFEALVNSIDGIVFEVDIETFRFQFVSRQVESLLGYPQQRWMDEPDFWERHLHPDDREEAIRYCKTETIQGRDHEFEYRMIAADGRELWFRDLVRVVCEDGKPRLLRGVMVDITKQRQTEVALHRSQKMEAVGRLAGGVAHDFNNLLTVIKGYSQLLLKSQPPDSIPRQYVEEIKKSADRSSALIRQLLAFSRRQVLQPHVIDLNALILDIREMLERLISEDIELGLSLDPALGRVKADPGQMEQVIMNLVVNARDAMPTGGTLSVITGNVELDEAVVHGRLDAHSGSYVMLAISDTGVGMDEYTKSHIYEPFFTTKAERGTGLGLSTVYGIVTQSNGFIEVESNAGEGTAFSIFLPRVDDDISLIPVSYSEPAHIEGTETILIVEDEEQLRKLVCEALRRCRYQVLEANNGEMALRVYKEHASQIDLLVTDVVMPRLSGPDLAQQILAENPAMKVIFMSGYSKNIPLDSGLPLKSIAFLWKPFEPYDLIQKVREVLDSRRR